MVQMVVDDDVEGAADQQVRPMLALYIGGMGAKGANFHYDVFARMGYEDDCARIQELYLGGRKDEATAAVPLELVEQVALVGRRRRSPRSCRCGGTRWSRPWSWAAHRRPCGWRPSWSADHGPEGADNRATSSAV